MKARKPALLIIDVVNHFDFPQGTALGRNARGIARRILALRERFDRRGRPVVYINDNWTQWQGGFDDLVAGCIEAGGDSAHLARLLAPAKQHFHVLKPKHSAFVQSALPTLLEQQESDAVVITGLATDSCVLATALDAHMMGYPIWVPSDCTAAIDATRKRGALTLLRHNTQASTLSSAKVQGLFPETAERGGRTLARL